MASGKRPSLKETLSSQYGEANVTESNNGSYIVTIDGYKFIVDSNGKISLSIISLNASKVILNASDESKKTFVISASSDILKDDVVWTTSDSSKVTVEPVADKVNEATLTGISTGKVTITATIGNYSETCEVEVVEYGDIVANITDFYNYTLISNGTGYGVSLNSNFKEALNSNSDYVVDGTKVWEYNTELPNPSSTYEGLPVINMGSMFKNCTVKNLNLSTWDTSNVVTMGSMFKGCSSLESLNVSSFNTSNINSMYYMFSECTNLQSLDLSMLNTSQVTTMMSTFSGCSSLTNLDISSFDTGSVTNMSYIFYSCNNLKGLNVTSFNTENVEKMENMFGDCSSIYTIDVSKFDTKNVDSMAGMFNNCTSLTILDVSGFNTEQVENMANMFNGCSSLTTLDVSGFNTESVENMANMFNGCSSLTDIDVSNWNTISLSSWGSMFMGCSSLKVLDLSNFSTNGVNSIYNLFNSCSNLELLDLSGFDTTNITNVGGAFTNCTNLKSILVGSESAKTTIEKGIQSSSKVNAECTVTVVQDIAGLKWLALGDSITEGYYSYPREEKGNYAKNKSKGWANLLSLNTGMQLNNQGVGGTGFIDPKSKTDSTNARTIIDSIVNSISEYDVVTIAYGINDWKGYQTLGTIDDDITAGDTVYSNMKYVVEKIKEINPTCKIIMITPLNTWAFGTYETNWGIGYRFNSTKNTLEDIFQAEKLIAEKYGLQIIDLTHNSVVVNNDNIQQMLYDKVHPSLKCHELLSQELSHKIKLCFAQ